MTQQRTMTTVLLTLTLVIATSAAARVDADERFKLTRAVPDDVFFCVVAAHNPERKFLEDYWGEVFEEFHKAGIPKDIHALIAAAIGESQQSEMERIADRASKLLASVDWGKLVADEFLFAERLPKPMRWRRGQIIGMPEMVWMFRGSEGAEQNFDGLSKILDAFCEELCKAAGQDVLHLERSQRENIDIASVDLLSAVPDSPHLPLALIHHDDAVVLVLGDAMFEDVLALLQGKDDAKPLAASARYKAAFEGLPEAEDAASFFDVSRLAASIQMVFDDILENDVQSSGGDVTLNAYFNSDAIDLNKKAYDAYLANDLAKARELILKAHELAPTDSVILYNLACYSARAGHTDEALDWLEKSVEAGYYAPRQISTDGDLESLRKEPRFAAALERARTLAESHADKADGGDAEIARRVFRRLTDAVGIIDYSASVAHTDGYATLTDARTMLVADAATRPFYPIFGKQTAQTDFARYLPYETTSFSVSGGISLDALYQFVEDTIRAAGAPGEYVLARIEEWQGQIGFDIRKDLLSWIQGDTVAATFDDGYGEASVMMLKVADEDAAREKLNSGLLYVSEMLTQLTMENPMLGMLAFRTVSINDERLPGFTGIQFGMSPQPAAIGVTDGYIIFGTSEEAVALCLATAAGEHPNVSTNKELMAEALVPEGGFNSMTYTDQRRLGANIAKALGAVSMAGGMVSMAIPEPEVQKIIGKVVGIVGKLSGVAQKIDFYKSSASVSTFDGKQWRTRSVTHYVSPEARGGGEDGR